MTRGFDRKICAALLCAATLWLQPAAAGAELTDSEILEKSRALFFSGRAEADAALQALVDRGKPDVASSLALLMRYRFRGDPRYRAAFEKLTGAAAWGWFDAMLWQEEHPELKPHPSFRTLKLEVLERLDPDFMRFLGGARSDPDKMRIRLEEVTWGGVVVDGIPALDSPSLIEAAEATYLLDDDPVFGVAINGDVRAYPLRIMGWHEMFNEVIGGVPVSLAYCTLCGAGILYDTTVEGFAEAFTFGSSGLLYRSNKLMYDRQTDSLWNQLTGKPVAGPLVESGIELKIRPVAITAWKRWRERHPATKVLSLETGYPRDYGSGVVYNEYFASEELMFPAVVRDEGQVKRKDFVFGLHEPGESKAWPLSAFAGGAVINDSIGGRQVVLVGDEATRSIRAYDRGEINFDGLDPSGAVTGPGGLWQVMEDFLIGPDGTRLPRLPGRLSYWFAWENYWGARSSLYQAAD